MRLFYTINDNIPCYMPCRDQSNCVRGIYREYNLDPFSCTYLAVSKTITKSGTARSNQRL